VNNQAALKIWIAIFFVASVLSGLVYLAVQHDIRVGANDPQIQIAEDIASALALGTDPKTLVSQNNVNVAKSLAPFTIIYDDSGMVTASSGLLNDQTPQVPTGVFIATRQNGEDRFTWQPQPGVRLATVVTHYDGPNAGFVLVGRSMREIEIREEQLTQIVFLGWLIATLGSFACLFFLPKLLKKINP
jgi:hypothetical protein